MQTLKILYVPQYLSELVNQSDQEKLFDFDHLSSILSEEDLAIYFWINVKGEFNSKLNTLVNMSDDFTPCFTHLNCDSFPYTPRFAELLSTIEAKHSIQKCFSNLLLTEPASSIGIKYYGVCNDTVLVSIVPHDKTNRQTLIDILEACNEYLRVPAEQLQLYTQLIVNH